MTKQHFELIAKTIRNSELPAEGRELIAAEFATALAGTNHLFQRSRFMAACRGEDSHDMAGRTVRYSETALTEVAA